MNKDLYIELLEQHVDDLNTAMKIDTVLSLQKTEKIKGLKSELVSVRDWNKAQDELISKIADTTMDYQDDLENLQADMAADHAEYREQVIKLVTQRTRESDLAVRLQRKIAVLEKENTRLGNEIVSLKGNIECNSKIIDRTYKERNELAERVMELEEEKVQLPMLRQQIKEFALKNENLMEDLDTVSRRMEDAEEQIGNLEADNSRLRSVTGDLEILNHDMGMELEKVKKEKENLQSEFYRLSPPVPVKGENK